MSNHHDKTRTKSLTEALGILGRFRWRFVVPAAIVMPAVLVAGMFLPRKYNAEAIFERRNDMVLSEILNRGASESFQNPRQSLGEEVIGGPAIDTLLKKLEPVLVKKEKADGRPIDREGLRGELTRKLTVKYDISTPELDRVRIGFVGGDPTLSQSIVNTLIDSYIEHCRAQMLLRLKQSATFFRQEVDRDRASIELLENKQLTFEIDHAELLPDNPNSIQASITTLQDRLADAKQQRDAVKFRVEALKKSLENTPETSPSLTTSRNPELSRLDDKLRELENTLALYTGVYKMTEKHPDLLALRQQIEQTKQQIAGTTEEVVTEKQVNVNPKRQEVELLLTNAVTDEQALDKQVETFEAQAAKMDTQADKIFPVRADYRKLARQVEETQRQLAFWEDNLRRVELAMAAEDGDRGVKLDFIKPCSVIGKPVSPDLMQVLMAALLLGTLAGGIGVFMAHHADESFEHADQLATEFSLPVFGAVSEIISRHQRRMRTLRHAVLYPLNLVTAVLVLSALTGLLYLSLERPADFERFKESPARYLLGTVSSRAQRAAAAKAPAPEAQPDPKLQSAKAE